MNCLLLVGYRNSTISTIKCPIGRKRNLSMTMGTPGKTKSESHKSYSLVLVFLICLHVEQTLCSVVFVAYPNIDGMTKKVNFTNAYQYTQVILIYLVQF